MKLVRLTVLLLLATAGGCRLAEDQKELASRRLTELVLTPMLALQSKASPSDVRDASEARDGSQASTATTQTAASDERAPRVKEGGTPAAPRMSVCSRAAAIQALHERFGTRQRRDGRVTVLVRVSVPAAPQCPRDRLNG